MIQVKLPDLGEGIEAGDVVSVNISLGDTIEKDQTLIEIETDKAVIPVPSTDKGVVSQVNVSEGDRIQVGQIIATLSGESGNVIADSPQKIEKDSTEKTDAIKKSSITSPATDYQYESKSGTPPPASPSVRRLAGDLGVDLYRVRGTANGGRITHEDLTNYVRSILAEKATAKEPAGMPSPQKETKKSAVIDFSKWGDVDNKSMSTLRKKISEKMLASWTTIPHVTQFDEADITRVMQFRKKYSKKFKQKGGHLTLTTFALKVILSALKKHPIFNTSIDTENQVLVYKNYYNIGIAVDSEEGLIVPVIKNIDKKSLIDLSIEMVELAEKAKNRKASLDDLRGGTFTISNLGSIGGTFFTPIINAPEVAIMGLGSGVAKPVYVAGKVEQRIMLPVCISYDHRVIDGAQAAKFIRKIVGEFEQFDEKVLEEV